MTWKNTIKKAQVRNDKDGNYLFTDSLTMEEFDKMIHDPYSHNEVAVGKFGHPHSGGNHQYFKNKHGRFCLRCKVRITGNR